MTAKAAVWVIAAGHHHAALVLVENVTAVSRQDKNSQMQYRSTWCMSKHQQYKQTVGGCNGHSHAAVMHGVVAVIEEVQQC
jgi:hypothetical protein